MLSVLLVPFPDNFRIIGTRGVLRCKAARLGQVIRKPLILDVLGQRLCLVQETLLVPRARPRQGVLQRPQVVSRSHALAVRRARPARVAVALEAILKESLVPRASIHEQRDVRGQDLDREASAKSKPPRADPDRSIDQGRPPPPKKKLTSSPATMSLAATILLVPSSSALSTLGWHEWLISATLG